MVIRVGANQPLHCGCAAVLCPPAVAGGCHSTAVDVCPDPPRVPASWSVIEVMVVRGTVVVPVEGCPQGRLTAREHNRYVMHNRYMEVVSCGRK